jgi:hypothetical protein
METQKTVAAKPAAKKEKTMFESLIAIQQELQTVLKDKKAFKGTYATIENVWESIRHTINGNGFVVIHQMSADGIKTTARHSSGEQLESVIPFSGNTDPQEKGKEITYAKRYNINAIFNVIVAEEDNDANRNLNSYKKTDVDGSLAASKLLAAKTKDQARVIFKTLSEEERNTTAVVAAVEKVKALA